MRYDDVMRRSFALVAVVVVLLAACVTYDSPPGEVDGGGAALSDGSGGSSGGSSGANAGGSSGGVSSSSGMIPSDAGSIDAERCTNLGQRGAPVVLSLGQGAVPTATGGDTVGTFVLTRAKLYAPSLPMNTFPPTTLRLAGSSFESISDTSLGTSGTLRSAASGPPTLVFNTTCGRGNGLPNGPFGYSISKEEAILIGELVTAAGSYPLEYTFIRIP
jgi:hypothetical protein